MNVSATILGVENPATNSGGSATACVRAVQDQVPRTVLPAGTMPIETCKASAHVWRIGLEMRVRCIQPAIRFVSMDYV